MRVSSDMPDDVIVLHDALEQLRDHKKIPVNRSPLPVTRDSWSEKGNRLRRHIPLCSCMGWRWMTIRLM